MRNSRRHYLSAFFFLVVFAFTETPLCVEEKTSAGKLLTLWAGMLPIILAAPHGGREPIAGMAPRRGTDVAAFSIGRDHNTAEMAAMMAHKLRERLAARPFLIVARFDRKYLDANRARKDAYESEAARPYYDAYHDALMDACVQVQRKWGRGLLLDIHGQGAEAGMIFRGTDNGRSVSALLRSFGAEALTGAKSILGQMELRGYRVAPSSAGDQRERRYAGGYTTRTYGSHSGTAIDAIQLELGASLRSRSNIDRTASDFADAIQVFVKSYFPMLDRPEFSVPVP
ncbi:MAG TPA: N-formylglutamate amidohydrolase [Candidatus Binatia bacterium]|nr:N-formylglutamate amidohydrolase [Candidatus Binatia bacterium]